MNATAEVIPLQALTKRCARCETAKSVVNFYRAPSRHDGHSSYCKACTAADQKQRYAKNRAAGRLRRKHSPRVNDRQFRANIQRRYGVSFDHVCGMLQAQMGFCANGTCSTRLTFDTHGTQPNRAFIDHCHATGRVRGILCRKCNTSAGVLENNQEWLRGLIEYLDFSLPSKRDAA